MTQLSAGEKTLLGLGRYRFRERLSTSFCGPRYRVTYESHALGSERPPPSDSTEAHSSLRPRPDLALAMRVVHAEPQPVIERLARAVQAVRDLEHRAILKPMQLVRSSTRLGVITPALEGLTLSQLLEDASMRQEAIPPPVALRIVLDVLEGLEALRVHVSASRQQEWLYGGLTPDAVLIGADGQTRILDPGLTAAAVRQNAFAHEAAVLAYTAPEQTGPDSSFDTMSDVFSVGVMLWELLTGRPLFGAQTAAQTLENLHRAPIARVQRQQFVRGEPIAASLAQAVSQALRREAAHRFTSYEAFSTALTQTGAPASPDDVGELVRQALTHESVEALQARIARVSAVSLPPQPPPNLRSLSWPPPRTAIGAVEVLVPRAATARVASRPPQPIRQPRITTLFPRPVPTEISAYPVGDLQTEHERRRALWPLGLAAGVLLGIGAWAAQRDAGDSLRQSTTSAASADAPISPASMLLAPVTVHAELPDDEPPHGLAEPPPSAAAFERDPEPSPAATDERAASVVKTPDRAHKPKSVNKRAPVSPTPPVISAPSDAKPNPAGAAPRRSETTFIPDDI